MLDPEKAWEGDPDRFAAVNRVLKNSFTERLSKYTDDLSPAIKSALNWFED
jgi:ATP-dependent phosphoenolpyruvate carboxykinase